jgi:hypothetical protein
LIEKSVDYALSDGKWRLKSERIFIEQVKNFGEFPPTAISAVAREMRRSTKNTKSRASRRSDEIFHRVFTQQTGFQEENERRSNPKSRKARSLSGSPDT